MAIAFDLKAPTKRHKLYKEYKATRKGMPDELASQMPILKEVLRAMNICIIEKEGYEADDILGTLAKWGRSQSLEAVILTGDRDSFQLIEENITVKIPRTKAGKTETEDYNMAKIEEEYGLKPLDLIEVKGLMGDSSDNIPGVPGVGEKTALSLIQKYKTIDGVYENIESQQGKLKEKLIENKELAHLSRELGTIDINAPIEKSLETVKIVEWNKEQVLEIFKNLKFNRFIDRFELEGSNSSKNINIESEYLTANENSEKIKNIKNKIIEKGSFFYYLDDNNATGLNMESVGISVFIEQDNKSYQIDKVAEFKEIFENEKILKCGYKQKRDYILLKKLGINVENLMFDIEIAGYILNSNVNKYTIEYLSDEYLKFNIENIENEESEKESTQMNLFDLNVETPKNEVNTKNCVYAYIIKELYYVLAKKMEETNSLELFNQVEMPLVEVLADMQYLRNVCR